MVANLVSAPRRLELRIPETAKQALERNKEPFNWPGTKI
jgi:hypothetical protein